MGTTHSNNHGHKGNKGHAHSHHSHQTFTQKLASEGVQISKDISSDIGQAVGTLTAMVIQMNVKFATDSIKSVFDALHMSPQFREIMATIESPLTYVIAGIIAGIIII